MRPVTGCAEVHNRRISLPCGIALWKEKRALDPQDQMTDEAATENTEDLDLDEATAELGLDGAKGSIGDGLVYRQ